MLTVTNNLSESGVLPSQRIAEAIKRGWILSKSDEIPDKNIQPASLDLRLGPVAYRLRCSFLPDNESVENKLRLYQMGKIDLEGDGGILEQNRPYLVPLVEQLELPKIMRAKANPKSSTGRLDIFTRIITDNSSMFDEIPLGYHGRLYLEIVPRTFAIRIRAGLTLNQLRLMIGYSSLTDTEIKEVHRKNPLLFRNGKPVDVKEISISNGLFLGLDLGQQKGGKLVGFRAKENSNLIDLGETNHYHARAFWEKEYSESGARVVLHPEKFYLLLSKDNVRIPPEYAAEMTAYDPTSGELRTHYAGFFDPGFGCEPDNKGSQAALEVRAHDVPFAVEHGQNICKLSFERMLEPPDRLYGPAMASNYQDQVVALSKHFKRNYPRDSSQNQLFAYPKA